MKTQKFYVDSCPPRSRIKNARLFCNLARQMLFVLKALLSLAFFCFYGNNNAFSQTTTCPDPVISSEENLCVNVNLASTSSSTVLYELKSIPLEFLPNQSLYRLRSIISSNTYPNNSVEVRALPSTGFNTEPCLAPIITLVMSEVETCESIAETNKRYNTMYWYTIKSIDYFKNIFDLPDDMGFNNSPYPRLLQVRYATGFWYDSNAAGFTVTMNSEAALYPDAICHEWGHIYNNKVGNGITYNPSSNAAYQCETNAIDEGVADIWSSLLRFYISQNEDASEYRNPTNGQKPDYNMHSVSRNFGLYYKPYRACAIIESSNAYNLAWSAFPTTGGVGACEHRRGMTIGHWFYLLSEGTNGFTHTASFTVPTSSDPSSFPCNSGTTIVDVNYLVEGIGHNLTGEILNGTLLILPSGLTAPESPFYAFRKASIQAVINSVNPEIANNQCFILEQLTEAWHAVNVGETMKSAIDFTPLVCAEAQTINIAATNANAVLMELYNENNELISTGFTSLTYFMPTTLADLGTHNYTLKTTLTSIDDVTLPSCVVEQPISIIVKQYLITNNSPVCEGDVLELSVNANPIPVAYSWLNSDGIEISSANVCSVTNAPVSASGIYKLILQFANGSTIEEEIPVSVQPLPNIEPISDVTACSGEILSITPAAVNAITIEWFDSEGNQIALSPTLDVQLTETATITVVAHNDCGSSNLVSFQIFIPTLTPTISAPQAICPGETATLTVNETFAAYQWNTGAITQTISAPPPGPTPLPLPIPTAAPPPQLPPLPYLSPPKQPLNHKPVQKTVQPCLLPLPPMAQHPIHTHGCHLNKPRSK